MNSNGVPVVSDEEFHEALSLGLSRLVVKVGGKGRAAAALQMTRQAFIEVENGTVPHVKRLFEALSHDETILDDVAALYRKKVIPDARDQNRAAPALVAALHKVIEAEADGSITHPELLAMEAELRDAEKRLCGMLQRIAEIRKPTAVA
jgi:hypothetical protein